MKLETLCLHGGQQPDPTTLSRAVPVYRTSSYVFKNAGHAANLFALKELGNIYTRLMNPTTDVLEKRVALLEGAHEMAGLGLASGTSAIFYAVINLARAGDNHACCLVTQDQRRRPALVVAQIGMHVRAANADACHADQAVIALRGRVGGVAVFQLLFSGVDQRFHFAVKPPSTISTCPVT